MGTLSGTLYEALLQNARAKAQQAVHRGQKIIVAGTMAHQMPPHVRDHPFIEYWFADGSISRFTMPASAGLVLRSRFLSHADVERLKVEAAKVGAEFSAYPFNTGDLREILQPLSPRVDVASMPEFIPSHQAIEPAIPLRDRHPTLPDPAKASHLINRRGVVIKTRPPESSAAAALVNPRTGQVYQVGESQPARESQATPKEPVMTPVSSPPVKKPILGRGQLQRFVLKHANLKVDNATVEAQRLFELAQADPVMNTTTLASVQNTLWALRRARGIGRRWLRTAARPARPRSTPSGAHPSGAQPSGAKPGAVKASGKVPAGMEDDEVLRIARDVQAGIALLVERYLVVMKENQQSAAQREKLRAVFETLNP